ncbi:MAG: sulfurtransferase TusA family protein [Dehalococcoidia bacterium]|nr:MAG: sulfurtransferase TusA family protein [Dehalococcoidia bacterium]
MVEVDVRGFVCPIPVVKTQKAIEQHPNEEIIVMVDNAAAKENVSRYAGSKGYVCKVEEVEDDYCIKLLPPGK